MLRLVTICVSLLFSISALAGDVIFEGYPSKKIEVTEEAATTYEIKKSQAPKYKVVIEREGDKYYWRTREDLQLLPLQSGAYVTFLAMNGAGYVRVLNNTLREMYKTLSEEEKQTSYLYMEHIVDQLGSITYYGR